MTEAAQESRAYELFIDREALAERIPTIGGELTERFKDAPEPRSSSLS